MKLTTEETYNSQDSDRKKNLDIMLKNLNSMDDAEHTAFLKIKERADKIRESKTKTI